MLDVNMNTNAVGLMQATASRYLVVGQLLDMTAMSSTWIAILIVMHATHL